VEPLVLVAVERLLVAVVMRVMVRVEVVFARLTFQLGRCWI
jgi:hypothetical protein